MGSNVSKATTVQNGDLSKLAGKQFDYVIVGGGTAGCVLASRLSENPNVSVLLLEAGKSHEKVLLSKIPLAFPKLFKTEYDWDYTTTPQSTMDNRQMYWPRGKILGGCSSVNAMMYHHCAPSDFDEWAKVCSPSTTPSWSYDALQPYFIKAEHFNLPPALANKVKNNSNKENVSTRQVHAKDAKRNLAAPDNHDDIDLEFRGSKGPWQTSFGPFNPLCQEVVRSCEELGIPYTPDFNTPKGTMGTAMFPGFVDAKGHRSSSATAYLTKTVQARKNLTIITQVLVTKLVIENAGDADTDSGDNNSKKEDLNPGSGLLKVVGVEIARIPPFGPTAGTPSEERWTVVPKKEVILSAGAIGTPQVLMLSGIGPRAELEKVGIKVLKESEHVGKHLRDHLMTVLSFRAAPKTTLGYLDSPVFGLLALARWILTGGGVYSSIASQAATFIRTDNATLPYSSATSQPLKISDETSGPDAPDIEILYLAAPYINHGLTPPPKGTEVFTMATILLRPQSEGTVTISSASAFDKAIIDPNYLATESDKNVLLKSLRLMQRIARTGPLSTHLRLKPHAEGATPRSDVFWLGDADPDKVSDEDLLEGLKLASETIYHPVGSARMGSDPSFSVVNAALQVHGVSNLRIVDASVFPNQVSGHPTAPIIALAERAADIIKGLV